MGRPTRRGFTLIELMIVVAIIGILAAIAIPKFADLLRKSREGATKGNLGALRSALTIYYADMEGNHPTDRLSSLTAGAKYIAQIPEAFTSYHANTSVVKNNDDLGMGAMLFADQGTWAYWNWTMTAGSRNQGDLWVGCMHTDTKGAVWSTY